MNKEKCVNYRNSTTSAIELDKSCKECAASKDSKNDASSGLSISQTCTWMIIWSQDNCQGHYQKCKVSSKTTFYKHQPQFVQNRPVLAYMFHHQLQQRRDNQLHLKKNAADQSQWMPVEDLDKPRHPIQFCLHVTKLMLQHIDLLLQTYNVLSQP